MGLLIIIAMLLIGIGIFIVAGKIGIKSKENERKSAHETVGVDKNDIHKIFQIYQEYKIAIIIAIIAIIVFMFATTIRFDLIRMIFKICAAGLLISSGKTAWGIYHSKPDPEWPGYQFSCEYGRKRPKEKEKTPVNWNSPGCLFPWLNPELNTKTEEKPVKEETDTEVSGSQIDEQNNQKTHEAEQKNERDRENFNIILSNLNKLIELNDNISAAATERKSQTYENDLTNEEAYDKFNQVFGLYKSEEGKKWELDYQGIKEAEMKELDKYMISATVCLLEMKHYLDEDTIYKDVVEAIAERQGKKYALPYPSTPEYRKVISKAIETLGSLCGFANIDDNAYKEVSQTYSAIIKGCTGEHTVNEYLRTIVLPQWELFTGAVLPIDPPINKGQKIINDFECDDIVVTEYGVFVIEVKNYETGSLVVGQDGKEKRILANGEEVSKRDDKDKRSMIEQCDEHVSHLIQLLIKNGFSDLAYKVHGIVVIANNNIELEYNGKYPIIRVGNLRYEMVNEKYQKGEIDVEKIAAFIQSNLKSAHKHRYTIPEMLVNKEERADIKALLTPLLVRVASKFVNSGPGCSNDIERYDPYPLIEYFGQNSKYMDVEQKGFQINSNERAFKPTETPKKIYSKRYFTEREKTRETFKFPKLMSDDWAKTMKVYTHEMSSVLSNTGEEL